TSMYEMFYGCSGLKSLDLSKFNTSLVNDMNNMFYGCENLESLDLSNFDTSLVTNMNNMFSSLKKWAPTMMRLTAVRPVMITGMIHMRARTPLFLILSASLSIGIR
ncbi:MAG: BspA family leucine-rich repeat surface protein, partial [Clostridia bacterium]|nr:BspA family leucine-rich repeat surface protein [Clostridia bacterium]